MVPFPYEIQSIVPIIIRVFLYVKSYFANFLYKLDDRVPSILKIGDCSSRQGRRRGIISASALMVGEKFGYRFLATV